VPTSDAEEPGVGGEIGGMLGGVLGVAGGFELSVGATALIPGASILLRLIRRHVEFEGGGAIVGRDSALRTVVSVQQCRVLVQEHWLARRTLGKRLQTACPACP